MHQLPMSIFLASSGHRKIFIGNAWLKLNSCLNFRARAGENLTFSQDVRVQTDFTDENQFFAPQCNSSSPMLNQMTLLDKY